MQLDSSQAFRQSALLAVASLLDCYVYMLVRIALQLAGIHPCPSLDVSGHTDKPRWQYAQVRQGQDILATVPAAYAMFAGTQGEALWEAAIQT